LGLGLIEFVGAGGPGRSGRRQLVDRGVEQCGDLIDPRGELVELAQQQSGQPGVVVGEPAVQGPRSARRVRARPRASSASTFGLRCPAISASIIARPDTPSTSVSTDEILIRASSSSFSIRCLTRVRSSTRS
jgi:hypothetical protein